MIIYIKSESDAIPVKKPMNDKKTCFYNTIYTIPCFIDHCSHILHVYSSMYINLLDLCECGDVYNI